MKAKGLLLILAFPFCVCVAVYFYLFGGPYRFVELPLDPESIQHLRSSSARSTPESAADEYMHGLGHPSDRPKRSELEITTQSISQDEVIVIIINENCHDDSIYATCYRLTMRFQNGLWMPIRRQAAWQCRNAIGWTTKTPS